MAKIVIMEINKSITVIISINVKSLFLLRLKADFCGFNYYYCQSMTV